MHVQHGRTAEWTTAGQDTVAAAAAAYYTPIWFIEAVTAAVRKDR